MIKTQRILLIAFGILFFNVSYCTSLIVDGIVTEKGKKSINTSVKAYDGNKLVYEAETDQNGTFKMVIPPESYVTVMIEKSDYITKYVIFDTRSENMPANLEPYECHIDLVKEEDLEGVDTSRIDFPIAVIKYDKRTKSFNHNQVYTANMIEEYNHLMNKSALKKSSGRLPKKK